MVGLKELDIVHRTIFAELGQRCLDANFQADFPVDGRFVSVPVTGRDYWYFDRNVDGKVKRSYVGPKLDPEITQRVMAFNELKGDLKSRRKLVTALVRDAGLDVPDRFVGDVTAALGDAGLFRLRGVLVGTVAYQTYGGLLGVRLPSAAMQTGDADFAQFHSVSAAVGDTLPPVVDLLRKLDPTFRDIPHQMDGRHTIAYENATRFRVEFLTPNRGSDEYQGKPATMPALGGASAQPLRFLDFLIREPVRSVLLHRSGISVTVPAPERYAIHKLIVAPKRRAGENGIAKRDKDLMQARSLMEALVMTRRQADLAEAYAEAWSRGPAWRQSIDLGMSSLKASDAATFKDAIAEGMRDNGEDASDYGLEATAPLAP